MRKAFADVQEFNRIAGRVVGDLSDPKFPGGDRTELAYRLIREEAEETIDAMMGAVDLPEVADGLADLIYVALDAAVAFGIDMGPVWNAVQAANLAKFPECSYCEGTGVLGGVEDCGECKGAGRIALRDAHGKIIKPPGWTPPDIAAVLAAQRDAHRNQWTGEKKQKGPA